MSSGACLSSIAEVISKKAVKDVEARVVVDDKGLKEPHPAQPSQSVSKGSSSILVQQ